MKVYKLKKGIILLLLFYVAISICYKIEIVSRIDREIKKNNLISNEFKNSDFHNLDHIVCNDTENKIKIRPENMIGYLYIPNTKIDFIIMQSGKDNPDYYLTHNIYGEYNKIGTPYMSAYCDPDISDNCIIYGHNISGEKVFGELIKYKDVDYYKKHKDIFFITNKEMKYKIIGVMSVNKNIFPYYTFVVAVDNEDYKNFLIKVKQNSMYECDEITKNRKQLLTLSTCDNEKGEDYRFVVVAARE